MKQKVSVPFMLLGILFNVCLIAANLLETKVIQVFGITVTAGLLVFPVSYIINDCIAEVWGFRKARLIIWSGFAMNFFVVMLGLIAVALPAAPFWEGAPHFNFIIAWQELLVMMCIQIVLKSLYEVMILPVTIRVVKAIKRIDGSDVYDEGISYKVWKITEI